MENDAPAAVVDHFRRAFDRLTIAIEDMGVHFDPAAWGDSDADAVVITLKHLHSHGFAYVLYEFARPDVRPEIESTGFRCLGEFDDGLLCFLLCSGLNGFSREKEQGEESKEKGPRTSPACSE